MDRVCWIGFAVVLTDQKRKTLDHKRSRKNPVTKIPDCRVEIAWMFHHLDTDGDMQLSLKELYYLEHDEREHCLKPYLNNCDEDRDTFLSAYEWCTCFDRKSKLEEINTQIFFC